MLEHYAWPNTWGEETQPGKILFGGALRVKHYYIVAVQHYEAGHASCISRCVQCVAGQDLLLRANATQPRRFGGKYPSYVRSAAAAEYKRLPSSKSNLLLALSQICNNNLIPGVSSRYPDIYVQIWTLLTIDGFYIFSRVVSTSSWMGGFWRRPAVARSANGMCKLRACCA